MANATTALATSALATSALAISALATSALVTALILASGPASAEPWAPAASPAQSSLCKNAIAAAELARRIPDAFLTAIAKVESGRPVDGVVEPWPWTINAEGAGSFYASKDDAIAAVRALQARGVRSIDVGCMQVNLLQHPEAFASLDQAFDPAANAQFAAGLLVSLFGQFGSWPLAAAAYHSQTPGIGAAYQKQVLAAWAIPDRPGRHAAPAQAEAAAPPRPPHNAAMAEAARAPYLPAAAAPAFGRQNGFVAAGPPRPGLPQMTGRSLASYRAIPVRVASQAPLSPG
jgi:hypothetical protein